MDKLQVVWEDNPDTPLRASNISKTIQSYKEGDLFFIDSNDQRLKLRANSKILMSIPETTAFFELNKSFSTHNSSQYFYPTQSNTTFRKEGSSSINEYSLAIENNSANMLMNSNFSSALTYWDVFKSGTSNVQIVASDESLFGSSAKITVDQLSNDAGISQSKVISSQDLMSFSFYYKSSASLKFQFIGNPQSLSGSKRWWRDDRWNSSEYVYILENTQGKWKRFELPSIAITLSDVTVSEIQIKIYSNDAGTGAGSEHLISNVQLELSSFCTSYTFSSREEPSFNLRKESIRMSQGEIDFEVKINDYSSDYNYLFIADTAENPALRFYLDNISKKFVFDVFNTHATSQILEENYNKCELELDVATYNSLKQKWIRFILVWDFTKETKEMKIYLNDGTTKTKFLFIPNATDFASYPDSSISKFSFGGVFSGRLPKYISNSQYKNLKFNIYNRSSQKILDDFTVPTYADKNDYKLFDVGNKNIVLNNLVNLAPMTNYYIWMCLCSTNEDESQIIINTNNLSPFTNYDYFSRLIGSFSTDSNSNILEYSVLDLTEIKSKKVSVEIVTEMPVQPAINGQLKIVKTAGSTQLVAFIEGSGWQVL